jgi:protein-S-isoprenylcysteine O-methyltransferase Ste14
VAGPAVALMAAYLALAFGVRVAIQLRRTGATGISSLRSMPALELLAGAPFAIAVIVGGINPLLALLDVVEPVAGLDVTAAHVVGFALAGAGIVGTFLAQLAMGASWRIGVDPAERTALVTGGLFSLSRNPIYSFMIVAWIGFALLVPTWLALAALALIILGLELQVRLVEEPHLLQAHGEPYRDYAARVGRFAPRLGRIRRPSAGP